MGGKHISAILRQRNIVLFKGFILVYTGEMIMRKYRIPLFFDYWQILLLYTRKLDTSCQAMRQEVMLAKFQPHASQMHLKWAEIRYCTQYAVYSNKNTNYLNKSKQNILQPYFILAIIEMKIA